jgi:type I restriction enzyme M protein
VCLWFLTRDKSGRNLKRGSRKGGRKGETLFIDARRLGTMQTRTLRVLTGDVDGDPPPDSDIGRISYAFRQWRGEPPPEWWDSRKHGEWAYSPVPGFCKAVTIEEIAQHGFVLTPGRYVGAEDLDEAGEPFEAAFQRLLGELETLCAEGDRVRNHLLTHLRGFKDG